MFHSVLFIRIFFSFSKVNSTYSSNISMSKTFLANKKCVNTQIKTMHKIAPITYKNATIYLPSKIVPMAAILPQKNMKEDASTLKIQIYIRKNLFAFFIKTTSLPYKRYQSVFYFLLVLFIACKPFFKHLFFILYSACYDKRICQEYYESYHRA